MKDEYHKHPAVSHSKLEDFRHDPAYYYGRHVASPALWPDEEGPALRFGRAFHALMLDGRDVFRKTFAVRPEGIDGRAAAGKAWLLENEKFEILSAREGELIENLTLAIHRHAAAMSIMSALTDKEKTYRTEQTSFGFQLQCRVDGESETGVPELFGGEQFMVDIKTIDKLKSWDRAYAERGYHRQAALYLDITKTLGRGFRNFVFIVVEKEPPYGVLVRYADADSIAVGRKENVLDMERLSQCYSQNYWPAGDEQVRHIGLPPWYKKP